MKRTFRKLLLFCVSLSLLLPIGKADAATSSTDVYVPNETVYNEGTAYIAAKSLSNQELSAAGLSEQEITELRSFSMEDALLERAMLPDSILHAYGYTDAQIELLREYDGSPLTEDSPVLAATSDCVGTYHIGNYSTSEISFSYTWEWSIVPLNKMKDTVVVAWEGIKKPDNTPFDLTPSLNTMYLHFYKMTTGERVEEEDYAINGIHVGAQNYTYFEFQMTKDDVDDNAYWAKEGAVHLTLYPEGSSSQINYIDLEAGYGHQMVKLPYTFTVSESLDISFSGSVPTIVVTKEDDASGRVYSDGRCVNYGSTV